MRLRKLLTLLAVPVLVLGMLVVACGDDDDDEEPSGGTGTEEIEPGVVTDKPDDAMQVDVTLKEWAVQTGSTSVPAGKVYFHVDNEGPEDAHEFVIIKSDLGPLDLPYEDDKVSEDGVNIVDEIEPFAPDSSASITVDLEPGKYVLICNISQVEDGEVESHYKKGMVATFTVE